MRLATKRLKDIVSNKDIVPMLMYYIYRDAHLYASNGTVTACTPVPEGAPGRWAVLASEFQQFLDRTDGELHIELSNTGILHVRCGKIRAQFVTLALDGGFDGECDYTGETVSFSDGFVDRLSAVRPFVSDNATKLYATCILFRGDNLYATSNVALVQAKSGMHLSNDFLLPHRVADYITKFCDGLDNLIVHENKSFHITWDDGSWLGANGLSDAYPNIGPVIDAIIDPTWEIPDDWRGCLTEAIRLGDQKVDIYCDKIISRTCHSTVYEFEAMCPLPEGLTALQIDPKYVQAIFDNSKALDFVIQGGKVHINFVGTWTRGVGLSLKI